MRVWTYPIEKWNKSDTSRVLKIQQRPGRYGVAAQLVRRTLATVDNGRDGRAQCWEWLIKFMKPALPLEKIEMRMS